MYGGKERCIQDFGWVPEGRRPLMRPRHRLGELKIKMDLQELGYGGMDWIYLNQNRDRWPILVKVAMNRRFHEIQGMSLLKETLLASQEGLCSLELFYYSYFVTPYFCCTFYVTV